MRIGLPVNILACAVLSGTALALPRKYGTAGCGLGSMIVPKNGGQITAATTNVSSLSKYFGITSGTSNCVADPSEISIFEQETFFFENYATLAKEAAQGQGSILDALATLLGCSNDTITHFNLLTQQSHSRIFSAPGAIAALNKLKVLLSENALLSQKCTYVSVRTSKEVAR